MGKFVWTNYLIDCDRKYYKYYIEIQNKHNSALHWDTLKAIAELESAEKLSGYAALLVFMLYDEGEYVEKNKELAKKYLDIACSLEETTALIIKANRESSTGEEFDKKLEELLAKNCNREYVIWETRAGIRRRKSDWKSKTFKSSYRLRLKYIFKAMTSVPKQPYWDNIRKGFRKQLIKMLSLPAIIIIAILIFIFAII